MTLHGDQIVAGERSREGARGFFGLDPRTETRIEPEFVDATAAEIDRAVKAASDAFSDGQPPVRQRADLLEAIAQEIARDRDAIVARAELETALGEERLAGEHARVLAQLALFADLVREGSWVDARIDSARPASGRAPATPDLRRSLEPIGPVAVFAASNFPLMCSVMGGDAVAALAAGCPVVIKAHPAHPGTSEIVAGAVVRALRAVGAHPGTFSLVHGEAREVGVALVRHPLIAAVAFTGSQAAGLALHRLALERPRPIPFHAEMGSVNPVFILPGALRGPGGDRLVESLAASVTLGGGQFCTQPGLLVGVEGDDLRRFGEALVERVLATETFFLHPRLRRDFIAGKQRISRTAGIEVLGGVADDAAPAVFRCRRADLSEEALEGLQSEVFGPSTIILSCRSHEEFEGVARALVGQLTATVHATEDELDLVRPLLRVLERSAGRLVWRGVPTGVAVSPAQHHGGPFPATTDARATSLGTASIFRFARPVARQGWPAELLPLALRDENPLGIRRLVDGRPEDGGVP